MIKRPIAVLISGRGSNLQALIDACAQADYPARVAAVISNNPKAQGLERAEAAGIATEIVNHRDYPSRQAFEQALDKALRAHAVEFVVLAGFMRVLTAGFVNQWYGKMINIHPSLLPAFRGAHAHREAIAAGVKLSGCTVHFVSPETDAGPIILQAAVPVFSKDTEETLASRVLAAEHRCLPYAVRLLAAGGIALQNDTVRFSEENRDPGAWIMHPVAHP